MPSEASRWLSMGGAVLGTVALGVVAPAPIAVAAEYLTLDAAQRAIFPDARAFEPAALQLSAAQLQQLAALAGPQPPRGQVRAWRVVGAGAPLGFFLTDEVVGRQDFIDYALGINPDGTLRTPEIMSYRESHGGEVRNTAWRRQFNGRHDGTALRPSVDIRNIAGATLSCEHVTAGVRYLSALWQVALRTMVAPP